MSTQVPYSALFTWKSSPAGGGEILGQVRFTVLRKTGATLPFETVTRTSSPTMVKLPTLIKLQFGVAVGVGEAVTVGVVDGVTVAV